MLRVRLQRHLLTAPLGSSSEWARHGVNHQRGVFLPVNILVHGLAHQDVVLEIASLHPAVCEAHLAHALLYSFHPLTLIQRPILPTHLPIAVPLIILVLSLILVA